MPPSIANLPASLPIFPIPGMAPEAITPTDPADTVAMNFRLVKSRFFI
jgi:hypothetical protein